MDGHFKYFRRNRYRRNADIDARSLLRQYQISGDKEIILKYIRVLERSSNIDDPDTLKHYIWALDQAGMIEDNQAEILVGLARGFFSDRWAYEIEERGITYQGDYYHHAPTTPFSAITYAENYIKELSKKLGFSLSAFYAFVQKMPQDPYYSRELDPEHFGFLIAMSALGHGIGLWEVVPSKLRQYVEVLNSDSYEIDTMCDLCGDVQTPDNIFLNCENPGCTHGVNDDIEPPVATICVDCRNDCDACGTILCATCAEEDGCIVCAEAEELE